MVVIWKMEGRRQFSRINSRFVCGWSNIPSVVVVEAGGQRCHGRQIVFIFGECLGLFSGLSEHERLILKNYVCQITNTNILIFVVALCTLRS